MVCRARHVAHMWQLGASLLKTCVQVGASSFMWRQQHVVGHHAYTNLHNGDPDICTAADPDLRCVTPMQTLQPHHVRIPSCLLLISPSVS